MRAVRVVVDIGPHTDRRVPAGFRGERRSITPDLALTMLTDLALLPEPFARSEVDRYLGMPGQAISYKVGERVWTQLRDDARAAAGASFDLKSRHAQAFDLGPMGLAQFTEEMRAVSPTRTDRDSPRRPAGGRERHQLPCRESTTATHQTHRPGVHRHRGGGTSAAEGRDHPRPGTVTDVASRPAFLDVWTWNRWSGLAAPVVMRAIRFPPVRRTT